MSVSKREMIDQKGGTPGLERPLEESVPVTWSTLPSPVLRKEKRGSGW